MGIVMCPNVHYTFNTHKSSKLYFGSKHVNIVVCSLLLGRTDSTTPILHKTSFMLEIIPSTYYKRNGKLPTTVYQKHAMY